MRVEFVTRDNGPERLVCEGEVLFDEGQFAGMKLCGFPTGSRRTARLYVTFPAAPSAPAPNATSPFDYLRSTEPDITTVKRVKQWVLDEFRARPDRRGEPRRTPTHRQFQPPFGARANPICHRKPPSLRRGGVSSAALLATVLPPPCPPPAILPNVRNYPATGRP